MIQRNCSGGQELHFSLGREGQVGIHFANTEAKDFLKVKKAIDDVLPLFVVNRFDVAPVVLRLFAFFGVRVERIVEAGALSVYAWALLDNHVHLLVRPGKQSLSSRMRRLLTGYVINLNRRRGRQGYLFQKRYKSILCL